MAVLLITLRFLTTRRVALIAALCLALAVAAMIVITAVMDGFRARIHQQLRGVEPDLSLRLSRPSYDAEERLQSLIDDKIARGDLVAAAPRLESNGLLWSQVQSEFSDHATTRKAPVRLLGIDFAAEGKVLPLEEMLERVRTEDLKAPAPLPEDPLHGPIGRILISERLAIRLRLAAVGRAMPGLTTSRVTLMTGRRTRDANGEEVIEPQSRHFDVLGTYATDRFDFDSQHIFIDRFALHELRYGRGGREPTVSRFVARTSAPIADHPLAGAGGLAPADEGLIVSTWRDANASLIAALDVEKTTVSLILGLIVLITAALIMGLLWLLVIEKTRDIGILRSMGLSRRGILSIFLGYAGVLGAIGSCAGVLIGVSAIQNLDAIMGFIGKSFGFEVFRRQVGYEFVRLPAILDFAQVWIIASLAFGLSLFSGAVAALRANRLDPLRCLRNA